MKASLQSGKSFDSAASSAPAQRKSGLKTVVDNRPTMVAQRKMQGVVAQRKKKAVIDITQGTTIKPGPPPTILAGNYYYKVFGDRNQADAMSQSWHDAGSLGVPTPPHQVIEVKNSDGNRWAFRSKRMTGTFFQFSKPGHITRVINWINKQTDRRELQRLRSMFFCVRDSIGDGQGFFEDTDGGNISFIDINKNGRTPMADDAGHAVEARLIDLGA